MHLSRSILAATLLALTLSPLAPARAQAPAGVEWLLPPAATPKPQTRAEDEQGKEQGRSLPTPELLQPTLDPRLPLFQPRYGADLGGHFALAASDTLPGLVRAWMRAFAHFYPHVTLDLRPPYEGTSGANRMTAGGIAVAFVSRELTPANLAAFEAKYHYPPQSIPVCGGSWRQFGFLDAVGFFVNRGNPLSRLSLAQLDAILSRTRWRGDAPITTWGQLGLTGVWAARPIHVYAIRPWNGFEEFVRQRVLDAHGQRGHWRAGLHYDATVFPIARRVAADPDGLGYAGLAFVDAPVKMLALGEGGRDVAPTYTNVALARYPLSRLVYANLNVAPGALMNPALQEFLRFILSRQGQQIVRDQGIFLPLRAFQARAGAELALRPPARNPR